MVANLADNIKTALASLNIRNAFGWTDSTVVLLVREKCEYQSIHEQKNQ